MQARDETGKTNGHKKQNRLISWATGRAASATAALSSELFSSACMAASTPPAVGFSRTWAIVERTKPEQNTRRSDGEVETITVGDWCPF